MNFITYVVDLVENISNVQGKEIWAYHSVCRTENKKIICCLKGRNPENPLGYKSMGHSFECPFQLSLRSESEYYKNYFPSTEKINETVVLRLPF